MSSNKIKLNRKYKRECKTPNLKWYYKGQVKKSKTKNTSSKKEHNFDNNIISINSINIIRYNICQIINKLIDDINKIYDNMCKSTSISC